MAESDALLGAFNFGGSGDDDNWTEKKEEKKKGYLTFFLDNDLFSGTDENYTNGVRLSWINDSKPIVDIPFVQDNLHRFIGDAKSWEWIQALWGFRDASEVDYSYGFALNQLIYTPETRDTAEPPPGERPYAGWAGLGFSLHARDKDILNSVEITLGVVGPSSFAEEAQNLVHDIISTPRFDGWNSQIPNEVTLNLYFNQRRRLKALDRFQYLPLGLELDGFSEIGYALGNFRTDVNAGVLLRAGWNLPLEFTDPRLTPTAHTQQLYSGKGKGSKWSYYGLVGMKAGAILHDITIDGPLFRSFDTGVTREPVVVDFYAGFGIQHGDYEFSFVHTLRSKTFKTEDGAQNFGGLGLRIQF